MNSIRWSTILGAFCLVLSGLVSLPFARAAVETTHARNLNPVAITVESDLAASEQELAKLPVVQETDPERELDGISLHYSGKTHPFRPMVAVRLGNRLDLQPDTTGSLPHRVMNPDAYDPDEDGASGLESATQPVEASGAFDENEKVIEEPQGWGQDVQQETIADPLEPINRVFFKFNDKLYFWVLKPVARGYKFVIPETLRVCVRNVFTNLATPIRAVNCLLQGKFRGFGRELLRFFVNSTAGMMGIADVATSGMHLEGQDEDFGQTLGFFGAGPGFFINWPILGPSSARDTIGLVGDWFVDPVNYLVPRRWDNIAVKGGDKVNRTSLSLGDYEALKKSALDPYVAVRDAYFQYRRNKINQ
jgi:phospholipid-binding lipoprotein MlaA